MYTEARVRRRSAARRVSRPPAHWRESSPEDLVRGCLEHHEDAWSELLRRYRNLIYSTLLRLGLPEDELAEAFQNTVEAIFRQLPRLRRPEKLVPWIIGIAWRQGVDRLRDRKKSRVTKLEAGALGNPGSAGRPRTPEEERLAMERSQQAREALDTLSGRCARIIQSLFYEDPPPDYREIARREGIPMGSLGPTRARCLERLRLYFAARGWLP